MLIERLCNASGVSGNEAEIRNLIKEEVKDYVDSIICDTMGNLICYKKGKDSSKKIMLLAHMDEVGFIVSGINEKGYLQFKKVGGIDNRVIISKKVYVGEDKIPGIIGMKAIHLQKKSERETVPETSTLYIDIGATSKSDAEEKVNIGDYVVFATEYEEFGDEKIKAKAIDDRIGCYVLINAIKKEVKYDTYFCFTVQEEVGLRGAQIASARVKPDIAIVLEATICSDVYGCEEYEYVTKSAGGVAISMRDGASIVPDRFRKFLEKLAEDNNIPYQNKKSGRGGNDAGAVYISNSGVLTASLSVPCRYLHSPVGVASKKDIQAMEMLVEKFMENADKVLQLQ